MTSGWSYVSSCEVTSLQIRNSDNFRPSSFQRVYQTFRLTGWHSCTNYGCCQFKYCQNWTPWSYCHFFQSFPVNNETTCGTLPWPHPVQLGVNPTVCSRSNMKWPLNTISVTTHTGPMAGSTHRWLWQPYDRATNIHSTQMLVNLGVECVQQA